MTSFSELPLDAQFLYSIQWFNQCANSWSALEQLCRLSFSFPLPEISLSDSIPVGTDTRPSETALSLLQEVQHNVQATQLISSNEAVDEIATAHLKYLLLDYLCAAASDDIHGSSRDDRLQSLRNAQSNLLDFFQRMHRYSLLGAHPNALEILSQLENEREGCTMISSSSNSSTNSSSRRQKINTRQAKIDRFRAEREAEKKISMLLKSRKQREEGDEYEEMEREISLMLIDSAIRKALDLFASVQREVQVLDWAHAQQVRGLDPSEEAKRIRMQAPPPTPPMPGMPNSFRIVSDRESERQKVFRPSHSLPTYSIEQWGEIQAKAMLEKQQRENEINAKKKAAEEEDEDENDDRDIREKRQWDDWKDDHNRGSGNTIR